MPANRLRGVPARFAKAAVVEVELAAPLGGVSVPPGQNVLLVAWLCGQPIGMTLRPAIELGSGPDVAAVINQDLGELLRAALPGHGLSDADPILTEAGIPHAPCAYRERLGVQAQSGPGISVIICTRERADSLRRCLESLLGSTYSSYEIVVIDNAPRTQATADVCAEFATDHPHAEIHYHQEPNPGLSRARNTGIEAARYDLVAFIDDDERADRNWLAALSLDLESAPDVGCVSGIVLPAELATDAQVRFEQFGGHSKGRGFARVIFDDAYLRERQPAMYPLPPFGVGANMAFRKAALAAIGGFDVALGAGTPSQGCEDTHAFTEVLLAGWQMIYTPSAVTWHYHRKDDDSLEDQFAGYRVGLGAYYMALIMREPKRILALAAMLPRALHDMRAPDSVRNASSGGLPETLVRADLGRTAKGPFLYLRQRARARRGLV